MEIREPVGSVRVPEQELLRLVSAVLTSHRADMSTGQVFALYLGWQVRSMTLVLGVINDVLRGDGNDLIGRGRTFEGATNLKPRASIIEQIEANGLGDWMDHEDWESTDWAKGMGADMRVTAKLAAHGVEVDRVERMMDLPEGQIDLWWKENEKFQRAAQASFWEQRERAPQLDPTKVLTPRQLRAAEAYFVDATSQKVAAEAAGVSDRTIRTWLKDPVFIYYGEQLRGERAAAISREREAMETRTLIRYLAQVEKALDVLDERLKKRDSKVALAVARPYMRSPR